MSRFSVPGGNAVNNLIFGNQDPARIGASVEENEPLTVVVMFEAGMVRLVVKVSPERLKGLAAYTFPEQ